MFVANQVCCRLTTTTFASQLNYLVFYPLLFVCVKCVSHFFFPYFSVVVSLQIGPKEPCLPVGMFLRSDSPLNKANLCVSVGYCGSAEVWLLGWIIKDDSCPLFACPCILLALGKVSHCVARTSAPHSTPNQPAPSWQVRERATLASHDWRLGQLSFMRPHGSIQESPHSRFTDKLWEITNVHCCFKPSGFMVICTVVGDPLLAPGLLAVSRRLCLHCFISLHPLLFSFSFSVPFLLL